MKTNELDMKLDFAFFQMIKVMIFYLVHPLKYLYVLKGRIVFRWA